MFRIITSSNKVLAQHVTRSTLNFVRTSTTDPEAGSIGAGPSAFGKKEKAEETRWAKRQEAEQAAKYRATRNKPGQEQPGAKNVGGSPQQRIAALEAKKQKIDQEIAELKRQLD
ncbi:unnamed protein product [Rotaria magnacalcarata]|uniref:Mitochondrial ATPase inhibitor n=1 Tax=Rotaria magnacalcarata TaxID=392030 RepID=A0A816PQG2_9BILA|nr:unnamed protein product [Rotaria magnacalcarata]CAF1279725.1 unnamed protein product [Rotaria magnacalcarata]CAF2051193.1 unnamed protein product [Rotaria magnacalcarata]CAF2145935.1 unnamed protein product [Rotaria magnacalcarata]CAF2166293.1 unnamed protein product [Rotaria magnacalcarata]